MPPGASLTFTKYCDFESPLTTQTGAFRIAEAFVYSFSDCIEVCASSNFYNADSNCTVAVYQPEGTRPGNCWVGNAASVKLGELDKQDGTDVAMFEDPRLVTATRKQVDVLGSKSNILILVMSICVKRSERASKALGRSEWRFCDPPTSSLNCQAV